MSDPQTRGGSGGVLPADFAALTPEQRAARAGATTPADSPMTMEDSRRVNQDLRTAKLAPGDAAFDFELPGLDLSAGIEKRLGGTVRLSTYAAGRPAALIFGSYT